VIDLSNISSEAWSRVVTELSTPAENDRAFMGRLLRVLTQVSGAREGVLFFVGQAESDGGDEADPRPVLVWPMPPGAGQGPPKITASMDAKAAVKSAAGSGQVRAFGIEADETYYEPGQRGGYVLAVPIIPGDPGSAVAPRMVISLLLEPRSKSALQTTIALVEVLGGYVHGHHAQQRLIRTRAAGAALDLAARLIASINTAPNFKGASMQMINDLSRQLGVDRVAMGWVRGRAGVDTSAGPAQIRVIAVSDTENIDRRMTMIQRLEAAMDECLDQEQPILYPSPDTPQEKDDLLCTAITHAHRELASSDANLKVASLPLRVDERVIGVILIESSTSERIQVGTIELLQAALDLVSPVLRIRRSDDRNLAIRARDSSLKAAAWAVGPKHTIWKLVGLLVFAVGVTVTFVSVPYHVEADSVFQPRVKRVISAPFEGILSEVGEGIEPGVKVDKGQLLVRLDDTTLQLNRLDALASIDQERRIADAALAKGDVAKAQEAKARADQARARLGLYEKRIADARILSPIAGTIISGDLEDKIGSSLQLGDQLFEIAPLDDMVVILKVDDSDIGLISRARDEHKSLSGFVATKAYPARPFSFTVEQIVPLAQPQEGNNVYEVRARLDRSAGWIKPGMEGLAKLDTGKRTILWILTRRIRDTLRLWLWW